MLICYVFFSIGGGDVKLMAMVGAFMGCRPGVEALLWTFVIGGAIGVIVLVWRVGGLRLLQRFGQLVVAAIRLRGFSHLRGGLGAEAKTSLHLAPSALLAVLLVHFELPNRLRLL
jgi:prepilin peptidase CpaA